MIRARFSSAHSIAPSIGTVMVRVAVARVVGEVVRVVGTCVFEIAAVSQQATIPRAAGLAQTTARPAIRPMVCVPRIAGANQKAQAPFLHAADIALTATARVAMLPMGHLEAKQKAKSKAKTDTRMEAETDAEAERLRHQHQNILKLSNRPDCHLGGQPAWFCLELISSRRATGCITSLITVRANGNGPQVQSRKSGRSMMGQAQKRQSLTAFMKMERPCAQCIVAGVGRNIEGARWRTSAVGIVKEQVRIRHSATMLTTRR